LPWCDVKRKVVDGDNITETLRESANLNHPTTLSGSDNKRHADLIRMTKFYAPSTSTVSGLTTPRNPIHADTYSMNALTRRCHADVTMTHATGNVDVPITDSRALDHARYREQMGAVDASRQRRGVKSLFDVIE